MTEEELKADAHKLLAAVLAHRRQEVLLAWTLAALAVGFSLYRAFQPQPQLGQPQVAKAIAGFASHEPAKDAPPVPRYKPTTKQAQAVVQKAGVDQAKQDIIAPPAEDKRPKPYGDQTMVTQDKKTGEVSTVQVPLNPFLATENRWGFGLGAAWRPDAGTGGHAHMEWEPLSFRLPERARGYRLFVRLNGDAYVFRGKADNQVSALLVLRRP